MEKYMAKVTIKDVAREAGVSISTVSNALNGVDVLKPETREHILEVANRLHYIPNLNGKNLKSKETKVIGLFVTSLKGPYFVALADSVFRGCLRHGYELNIFATWDSESTVNNILGNRVDGSIVLDDTINEADIRRIADYEVPAVFLDREAVDKRISSVVFDSYQDGKTAAEYILKQGAKRIGFVQGVLHNFDAKERFRGFLEVLNREGVSLLPEYILEGGFDRDIAYASMSELLQKKLPVPDAVFASNDQSAIGVMEALQHAGYCVPKDTMVVGVDNIELGQWFQPTLTTIHTNYETQGAIAVEKLMKLINAEETGTIEKISGKLIERESTKIH